MDWFAYGFAILLDVLDSFGRGDVAGVDAQAAAVAGHVVVGAVVHGAVVGADHIQTLHRGVVGLEGAQPVESWNNKRN